MGFLHSPISFLFNFLTIFLLILPTHLHVVAQDDPLQQYYNIIERDALYALKAEFNNTFLNNNWNGLQYCLENSSSWFGVQCLNNRVNGISLEGIGLTGKVHVQAFSNFSELSSLSFKNNWISGNIMDFSSNTKLVHVDLSSNMFEGTISHSLLGLQALESLRLQDNNLMGPIPGFSQKSLKEFNVSNNNLSGNIPKTRVLQSFDISSYMGNPGLCGSPTLITCLGAKSESDESENNDDGSSNQKTITALFLVLIVIAVVSSVVFFTQCYNSDKKIEVTKRKEGGIAKNIEKVERGENRDNGGEDRRNLVFIKGGYEFEIGDLLKASAEMLGKGNFGNAYKAMLHDGPDVVVKRLRDLRPLSREEFVKKIRALANLKHPNLLPPLAYYYSKDEKLLVCRFAEKGNLFDLIHGGRGQNRVPFKWAKRIAVAKGVARAMEFLHANTKSVNAIPHGNLKSSNVLLDENGVVLVSDYGLASLITLPIATQRLASFKSPEYQDLKKISKKADIWSYGSLLLELLTGRVSTYSAPRGTNGVDLCSWVHRAVREEWTAEIFDSEISQVCMRRNEAVGMMKLLQLALWCCDKSPEKRPDMSQVLREVESIKFSGLEDDEGSSFDRSLTEDSISTNGSGIIGEQK